MIPERVVSSRSQSSAAADMAFIAVLTTVDFVAGLVRHPLVLAALAITIPFSTSHFAPLAAFFLYALLIPLTPRPVALITAIALPSLLCNGHSLGALIVVAILDHQTPRPSR